VACAGDDWTGFASACGAASAIASATVNFVARVDMQIFSIIAWPILRRPGFLAPAVPVDARETKQRTYVFRWGMG
jgi:hypothetical protein